MARLLVIALFFLQSYAVWAQSTVTVEAVLPGVAQENGVNATFRFSRLGDLTGTLTLNFTRDGTTTAGDGDFSANDNGTFEAFNQVVFGSGVAERLIVITATPDNLVEGDETFDITLAPGSYTVGSPGSAGITLVDDPPVVTVTAKGPATENGAPGQLTFARSGGRIDASINVNFTRDATTTAVNADIQVNDNGSFLASNLVNLAANQSSRSLTFTAAPDNLVEGDETFDITLAPGSYTVGSPGSAGITLVDDPPVVTVTAKGPATENGAPGQLTFARSGGRIDASINVNFTRDATTTAVNADIQVNDNGSFLASNLVNLAANQSSRSLTFTAAPDNLVEGDETFDITLAPGSYTAGSPGSAAMTLVDNPVLVTVEANGPLAVENGIDGSFLFRRTGGDATKTLSVTFIRDPTTTVEPSDFTVNDNGSFEASNLVALTPGVTERILILTAVPDGIDEDDERLDITIEGDGATYLSGDPGSAGILFGGDLLFLDRFEEPPQSRSSPIQK